MLFLIIIGLLILLIRIIFVASHEEQLVFLASQYHFKVWGSLYRGDTSFTLTRFRDTTFKTQQNGWPVGFHGNTERDATVQRAMLKNKEY